MYGEGEGGENVRDGELTDATKHDAEFGLVVFTKAAFII